MVDPLTQALGIFCGLLAGFMFTYGAILQKKGVGDLPELKFSDIHSMLALLKHRTWLAGVVIGSLGGIPYVLSQSWIGIGYTQLLIAVGLILLAIMASRTLHEPLGKMEYTGIGLIILGTVSLGIAQLGPVTATLSDPNFVLIVITFYVPFFAISAAGLIFYKFSAWQAAKILGIVSGLIFGCGAGFSQMGMMAFAAGNWVFLFVGFLILAIGTVLGTVVANVAFQKGKAIVVIPLQSAGNYLIPVFAGLLVFHQVFQNPLGLFYFIPALILIMVGVFLLSGIQAEMEKSSETTEPTNTT